jgi:hypothetical protein
LDEGGFPVVVVDPLRVADTKCISIGATNFTGGITAAEPGSPSGIDVLRVLEGRIRWIAAMLG